jgi:uncharacterized protein (DUF1697 family)
MTAYVALLRAVNVAGTGKLPMAELKAMGEACGFSKCRTFIASGNLLFTSKLGEAEVKEQIEQRVADRFGRHVPVYVRSGSEMAETVRANPFGADPPNRVLATFIDDAPVPAMIDEARNLAGERLALGPRVIYIAYPQGAGVSKLKLPAAVNKGTARNMNTVAKIAELLAEME